MAVSIGRALARIKADVRAFVPDESIEGAARDAGHRWRERQLGPVETVHLFVLQVIHFNTAMRHLRHLAGHAVNAAAYCEARMRLPLEVLRRLLRDSAAAGAAAGTAGDRWCGLRVLLVDGSSTIAPDTPASRRAFGQPTGQKPGCGFPVPKILALFDAFSGMVLEALCLPLFTHEQSGVWRLHPMLGNGDLLVGDRGFCSFAHLAMLFCRDVYGLFRMHQRQVVDFTPGRASRDSACRDSACRGKSKKRKYRRGVPNSRFVRKLGAEDQIVEWNRPANRPVWMTDGQFSDQPDTLRVRELRYRITARGMRTREVTIATTLLDPMRYPKRQIARLYGLRWEIETNFRHLKTTMKMEHLKCRSADGVMKELMIFTLVYNLIRAAMSAAAQRQAVADANRISFIDAARCLRSMLTAAMPTGTIPELIINPIRPSRHHPRVKKRRMKEYDLMNKPRSEYAKATDNQDISG